MVTRLRPKLVDCRCDPRADRVVWGLVVPESMAQTEVQDSVLEFSAKTGLIDMIESDHIFSTVDAAVFHIKQNQKGEN